MTNRGGNHGSSNDVKHSKGKEKMLLALGLLIALSGLSPLVSRNVPVTSRMVSVTTEKISLSLVKSESIEVHDDTFFYDRLKKCIPCSPEEERKLTPYIPRLIIPGTQKSGTTLVHNLLAQHPNVSELRRESRVFDQLPTVKNDTIHQCEVWNQYKELFDQCQKCQRQNQKIYHVDKTPAYLFESHLVPSRLACAFPTPIKLLVLLRDPTDRCFSQYQMMVRNKRPSVTGVPGEFFSRIQSEHEKLQTSGVTAGMEPLEGFMAWKRFHDAGSSTLMSRSLYALQLSHWIDTLSALWSISREKLVGEYFLVLDNDVVKENPQAAMDRILDFVGLAPYQFDFNLEGDGTAVHNYTALTDEERAFLDDYYQPYNVDLHHLMEPYGVEIGFAKRAAERSR